MASIMVVDDSQFMRMRVANFLTKHGYDIIEAEDGEEAVQTYRLVKPDVVLMDMAMPRKNGRIALSEILEFDPQAKVIMVTALGQQAIMLRALQAGAKDFLVKPCEPDQILAAVQKVLR
jgi:two-component system chemotaxis response regulator CheY